MKVFARCQRLDIQMPSAENEGAGPVRQTAGPVSPPCPRLKDPGIRALGAMFRRAVPCGAALGCAGDLAQNRSKGSTQSIGGVSVSEPHRIDGLEMEADAEKIELHALKYSLRSEPASRVGR